MSDQSHRATVLVDACSEHQHPGEPDGDATTKPGCLRILASGIDNVYASVAGRLDTNHLADLVAVRELADEADDPQPWVMPVTGRTFLVMPRPRRGYSVLLRSAVMDVLIGVGENSKRVPMLIELRSLGIHISGVERLVVEAHEMAAYFCPALAHLAPGDGMKVSRIDLYADTQGWAPTLADDHRWVCRARHIRHHDISDEDRRTHTRMGRRYTGPSFGCGGIAARVYNKSAEMAAKGTGWMQAIWKEVDWEQATWRIEVQYRREALTSFRMSDGEALSTVKDALDNRQALWEYGVGSWLTLRRPDGDSNRSRWPLDPVWEAVQGVRIGSPRSSLVRHRANAASHARLVQGMTGYLSSLIAHQSAWRLRDDIAFIEKRIATGTDEDWHHAVTLALQGVEPAIRGYLDERQRRFMAIVDDKKRKNDAT